MRTPREVEDRKGRKARVPFGGARQKLSVSGLPEDTVGRWVNDDGVRIEEMLDRGYRFVDKKGVFIGEDILDGNSALDSRVSKVVGRGDAGNPVRAYLMAIPKEYHEEDQQAKSAEIEQTESAIRDGQHGRSAGDKRYVPEGRISLKGNYNP